MRTSQFTRVLKLLARESPGTHWAKYRLAGAESDGPVLAGAEDAAKYDMKLCYVILHYMMLYNIVVCYMILYYIIL